MANAKKCHAEKENLLHVRFIRLETFEVNYMNRRTRCKEYPGNTARWLNCYGN
jgi:hypothetical protein